MHDVRTQQCRTASVVWGSQSLTSPPKLPCSLVFSPPPSGSLPASQTPSWHIHPATKHLKLHSTSNLEATDSNRVLACQQGNEGTVFLLLVEGIGPL
eukprot:1160524-Pelagomonas_calceolata.AAC.5